MRIILQHDLEMLKVLVLNKAEIQVLIPSIIKTLAANIFSTTKKRLSDTTLKRIFGFADTSHQPSLYTVNVLAEFCGYSSYQEFCERQIQETKHLPETTSSNETNDYFNRARIITEHTLQALKNKSGIPFHLTISREFLHEHLSAFEQSNCTATVISAPSGYGKTISLCHWAEEKLNDSCKSGGKDIVLFLSGKVLNRGNLQSQLFDWLTEMIGLADHGISNALGETLAAQRFYLIIDAFDTTSMDYQQWVVLLDLLMDGILVHQHNPNLKIILTMRSSSWIDCRRRLVSTATLDKWYEGFWTDKEALINVSLFNAYELKNLCARMSPKCTGENLCPEVLNLFSYPLFFQYFYQKNKDLSLETLDTYHVFDVIHHYIYEKVYTGNYSTEKIMLINAIIDHATLVNCRLTVEKIRIYEEITLFKDAFRELKSIGLIKEINHSDEQGFAEQIEFAHEHLHTYFLASKISYNHQRIFDQELINSINNIPSSYFRLKVLKWCIFTALKTGQHFMFEFLPNVNLIGSQKRKLIRFLGHLIDNGYLQLKFADTAPHFDLAYPKLFDYLFAIEFCGPGLDWILKLLSKQNLSTKGRIALEIANAISNLISLDSEAAELTLSKVKALHGEKTKYFAINPIKCLETLYYYLRYNVVKQQAFEEITHFYFNPQLREKFPTDQEIESVIFLMALTTLQVTGNIKKQLRFVDLLLSQHEQREIKSATFEIIMLINKAQLLLTIGRYAEAEVVKIALKDKMNGETQEHTAYIEIRMDYLEAQLAANQKDIPKLIELTDKYSAVKKSAYAIIEVNILKLLLMSWPTEKDSSEYRTLHIRFIKLIQGTRFSPKAYLFHFNTMHDDREKQIEELIRFPKI